VLADSSATTAWYFVNTHQVFLQVLGRPKATIAHPARDVTLLVTVDSGNVLLPVARVTEDAGTVRALAWVVVRKRESVQEGQLGVVSITTTITTIITITTTTTCEHHHQPASGLQPTRCENRYNTCRPNH
jgi:hypothetical protein